MIASISCDSKDDEIVLEQALSDGLAYIVNCLAITGFGARHSVCVPPRPDNAVLPQRGVLSPKIYTTSFLVPWLPPLPGHGLGCLTVLGGFIKNWKGGYPCSDRRASFLDFLLEKLTGISFP